LDKQAKQDSFHISINQPHVQTQIGETMTSVARSLAQLREIIQNQDPEAHLLLGVEALPVPPGQHEVSEGEASTEPTEDPKTDLLVELMERED